MAFSLALAGSVMVTVSVISIIPECLHDDSGEGDTFKMIPVFSVMMFWRLAFFLLGAALYFALSWCFNVPEPEELMHSDGFHALVGANDDKDAEMSLSGHAERQPFLMEAGEDSSDRGMSPRMSPRIRKSTSSTALKTDSPGDNNGKLKRDASSSAGFSAWSTGKDLQSKEEQKAWRVAMLLFVSLLVHNFPEGLAVAASALESTNLGITVTIGIMIHNIPEGIAIAIPCLAARPDQPWLSFVLASVSGLAEPMGAFVALICMRGVEKDPNAIMSLENILAFVAGIMVIVSLCELFPEANRHATETRKYFWYGNISGIVVMVATELYLP